MEKRIILGWIVTQPQKNELQVLFMYGILIKCHLCCSFKSTENVTSGMGKEKVKACKLTGRAGKYCLLFHEDT